MTKTKTMSVSPFSKRFMVDSLKGGGGKIKSSLQKHAGLGKSAVFALKTSTPIKQYGLSNARKSPKNDASNTPDFPSTTSTSHRNPTLSKLSLRTHIKPPRDDDSDTDDDGEPGFGPEGDDENQSEEDDDCVSQDWNEGKTLVEGVKGFEDEEETNDLASRLALVDELKGPMAAQSKMLKNDLVDVLVPAMDKIRFVHAYLEEDVEAKLIAGTLTIDRTSDEYHASLDSQHISLRKAMDESQTRLKQLFGQLKAEYEKKEEQWSTFKSECEVVAVETRGALADIHTTLEKTIASVEKKCKVITSEANKPFSGFDLMQGAGPVQKTKGKKGVRGNG